MIYSVFYIFSEREVSHSSTHSFSLNVILFLYIYTYPLPPIGHRIIFAYSLLSSLIISMFLWIINTLLEILTFVILATAMRITAASIPLFLLCTQKSVSVKSSEVDIFCHLHTLLCQYLCLYWFRTVLLIVFSFGLKINVWYARQTAYYGLKRKI